ncbi:MAG TPA: hypothetical protein VF229_05020 [Burkholderiaceae bacterium]
MRLANPHRLLAVVATVVVAGAVVAGVAMMDSPAHQRQRKLDARRVEDLTRIQSSVNAFWRLHKALPQDLQSLAREPGFGQKIVDPETGAAYDYEITGADAFRLCAVFAADSADQQNPAYPVGQLNWAHGAGQHCFELKVAK